MRVLPPELSAQLGEAEIMAIEAHPVRLSDATSVDAIDLAIGWAARVEKFDADRALPWSDRTVWNEHDLAGALFARDFLQTALDGLPVSARDRLAGWIAVADERFRSYTVDDPDQKMAKIADVDLNGRPWWWRRVPVDGPIVQDLANY
ncbi:hypothetical protein [Actinoplanes sp. NPDC026619]|uniref:hypothetical protein n=1 Tax=Actinoplanes sp. NPDC026619 TaxID=3155798 RepID=UPI0033D8E81E